MSPKKGPKAILEDRVVCDFIIPVAKTKFESFWSQQGHWGEILFSIMFLQALGSGKKKQGTHPQALHKHLQFILKLFVFLRLSEIEKR